ncbi:MAG: ATP-grasp fold amidoligase family protein [Candidatus Limivicinus sp.]|jgi:hypothetical protein
MSKLLKKARDFCADPQKRFYYLTRLGLTDHMSDEAFLKKKFKLIFGYDLDLDNPKTFNEKLQWLKLYNRRPEYTMMVDKYKVRDYIKEKLGEEYLIPLLGVWDDPDEIDFDSLPSQFVLKTNHDSGGICICKDKSQLNVKKVKQKLKKSLSRDYYMSGREWPYKNIPRKIICEKYMEDESGSGLTDYKVLCFNGEPKLIELHRGRFSGHHTQDFYDTDWNLTEYSQIDSPGSGMELRKPEFSDEMIRLSRILAENIPHVRVDWYYVNGQLYFGELTFFDASGFSAFAGNQDLELGKMIKL